MYRSLSGHRVCYATLLSALQGSSHELPETLIFRERGGEDGEDEDANDEEKWPDEPKLEEGDRIFATVYPTPPKEVNATSTISQWIAKGFARNMDANLGMLQEQILKALWDFEDIFTKTLFDSLPEHREWDHAIELVSDLKSPHRKLYPLSPIKQAELDKFLDENLSLGWIRPSKSHLLHLSSSSKRRMDRSIRYRIIGT